MLSDTGALTSLAIKNAREGKHFDGGGLFLFVHPSGYKYWRLNIATRARSERSRLAYIRR